MQFTHKHLTRIREIWEAFSQAYNSYSDESPGSKVMGPDQFVVAASQLMEEARREALKEMDEAHVAYNKSSGFDLAESMTAERIYELRKEYSNQP